MEDRATEAIGILVRRYRQEHKLTQMQLANLLHVDQGTVSRLEDRTRLEPIDPQARNTIESFARLIGRPPEYFWEIRQSQVRAMAEQAFAEGIMEPEDFALFLETQRELRRLGA